MYKEKNLSELCFNSLGFLGYLPSHCILHVDNTAVQGLIGQTELTFGTCNMQARVDLDLP